MFCYPKGNEGPAVRELVREAGFLGARSVEPLEFTVQDPFLMPTTVHVYPMPFRRKFHRWQHVIDPLGPLRVRWAKLRSLGIPLRDMRGWLPLSKAIFTKAVQQQKPVFHLWGHSEEVKRLGLWEELDAFLAFVAGHPNITHRTNGEIIASLPR